MTNTQEKQCYQEFLQGPCPDGQQLMLINETVINDDGETEELTTSMCEVSEKVQMLLNLTCSENQVPIQLQPKNDLGEIESFKQYCVERSVHSLCTTDDRIVFSIQKDSPECYLPTRSALITIPEICNGKESGIRRSSCKDSKAWTRKSRNSKSSRSRIKNLRKHLKGLRDE